MNVQCPQCDHFDIREKNTAYAELRVLEWEWDPVTNQLQPAEYESDASADWEVEDTENQYICADCRWAGRLDQLTVTDVELPGDEQENPDES